MGERVQFVPLIGESNMVAIIRDSLHQDANQKKNANLIAGRKKDRVSSQRTKYLFFRTQTIKQQGNFLVFNHYI